MMTKRQQDTINAARVRIHEATRDLRPGVRNKILNNVDRIVVTARKASKCK